MKKSIDYFKTQDRADILQQEYSGVINKESEYEEINKLDTQETDEIDSKFLKS